MNMAIYVHYADLDITTKLYALLFPLLVVFFLGVWDDLTELKAKRQIAFRSVGCNLSSYS